MLAVRWWTGAPAEGPQPGGRVPPTQRLIWVYILTAGLLGAAVVALARL